MLALARFRLERPNWENNADNNLYPCLEKPVPTDRLGNTQAARKPGQGRFPVPHRGCRGPGVLDKRYGIGLHDIIKADII